MAAPGLRHKFFIPIGFPALPGPPSTDPYDLRDGDTYWDYTLKLIRTLDAAAGQWVSGGGGSVTAGKGLTGGGATNEDIVLDIGAGTGILVEDDAIALDVAYTNSRYVTQVGDVMTGPLLLPPADPTVGVQAAHKNYVDGRVAGLNTSQVVAGAGLYGGGAIGANPAINVGQGSGLSVGPDSIALDYGLLNQIYAPVHSHPYASASHTHAGYAPITHNHTLAQSGLRVIRVGMGNIAGGATKRSVITHNLNKTIVAGFVSANNDQGTTGSLMASIDTWTTTTITVLMRNHNASTQENDTAVSILLVYNP